MLRISHVRVELIVVSSAFSLFPFQMSSYQVGFACSGVCFPSMACGGFLRSLPCCKILGSLSRRVMEHSLLESQLKECWDGTDEERFRPTPRRTTEHR